MKKELRDFKFIKLYYWLFGASAVTFFALMFFTDGMILEDILHKDESGSDFFMDFFNSVRDGKSLDVYSETGVIYPPLANIFFFLVSKMIKPELAALIFKERLLIQSDIVCLFIYFFFVAFALYLFTKTVKHKLVDEGLKKNSEIFTLLLAFSYPMVYCFQRGNLIMLAAVLTMFFVFNRNSKNKYIREISYISLAVAAGLKLYPAIFGLLLLFDGKYKQAVRLAVYGIVFIFVPFVFYGGISAVADFIENATSFSGKSSVRMKAGYICVDAISHYISEFFNVPFNRINTVLLTVTYSAATGVLVFSVKEWQKCWALAYMIMNFASFSRTYTLLFALIPFLIFILQKDRKKKDVIYFLCFAAFFIVIPAIYYPYIDDILDFIVNDVLHKAQFGHVRTRTIVANPNRAAAPFLVSGMMLFMFADVLTAIIKKEHKLFDGLRLKMSNNN